MDAGGWAQINSESEDYNLELHSIVDVTGNAGREAVVNEEAAPDDGPHAAPWGQTRASTVLWWCVKTNLNHGHSNLVFIDRQIDFQFYLIVLDVLILKLFLFFLAFFFVVIIYDSMTLEQIHFHVSINRDSQLNCVPSSIFRLVSVVCVAACSTATATFTQSNRFFHSTKNKPTKPKNKSRAKKRKPRRIGQLIRSQWKFSTIFVYSYAHNRIALLSYWFHETGRVCFPGDRVPETQDKSHAHFSYPSVKKPEFFISHFFIFNVYCHRRKLIGWIFWKAS